MDCRTTSPSISPYRPTPTAPAAGAPLIALVAAGFAVRLALIWSGACDSYVVADDAYYYFTIARNVAHGLGATFDGLSPTNGFHPLWMAMLVPLAWLTTGPGSDPWAFVHAALTMCATLDIVTAVILARVLKEAGYAREAPWAVGAWLLFPVGMLLTLRGLEAALSTTLVCAWLMLAVRQVREPAPRHREALALGGVFACAVLARTDNALFLGFAAIVATSIWAATARPRWRRAAAWIGVATLAAAVVLLPWVLWMLRTFGSVWQVSGTIKMMHRGVFGQLSGLGAGSILHLAAPLAIPLSFVSGEEFSGWSSTLILGWISLVGLLMALPALVHALRAPRRPAALTLIACGGSYLVAHAIFYAFVLRSYVAWYAPTSMMLLIAIVAGISLGSLFERQRHAVRLGLWTAGLVASVLVLARFFQVTGIRPQGPQRYLEPVLASVAQRIPGARTIGAFNAGKLGYLAPRLGPFRVVNLDGLVNNQVIEAWRRGQFEQYIHDTVDLLYLNQESELEIWLDRPSANRVLATYPPSGIQDIYGPAGRPVDVSVAR